jgi:Amt family ammonium transporter
VALGAALLWFGWFGFNAGSALGANETASLAFINTQIAAAFAAITWLLIAWHYDEKPSFVEMLIGMIAGLATITPAAGFVSPQSAMVIGVAAGVVCYFAVVLRKKKGLDDALDVWGVHGVGGALGIVLLGVLASESFGGQNGLYHGDQGFFMAQLAGLALACAWAFIFTYGMLHAIDKVTPVRVDESDEASVDEALHGEAAYTD